MNTTQERSSSILNTLRKSVALRVAAGIGSAALFTGCASNTEASSPEQTSAPQSASATPSPVETVTPVEKIDTPKVDHSDTGINSIPEAVAILGTELPIDMNAYPDLSGGYKILIEGAKGDPSGLDLLGVTVQDIAVNYEMSRIYLEKVKPYIEEAETELPEWMAINAGGVTPVGTYNDARATKYLLGEVLNKYQNSELVLKTTESECPKPDDNTIILPDGNDVTTVAPDIGVFRFSYIAKKCANLGEVTTAVLKFLNSGPQLLVDFAPAGSATQKIFKIEVDIASGRDADVEAVINNYRS